jgi:hypothetical protein
MIFGADGWLAIDKTIQQAVIKICFQSINKEDAS